MQVSVTGAKSQLTELVGRAEAGDEIVLICHGRAAVRLVPVEQPSEATSRRALEAVRRSAASHILAGPSAARSQDDLYGDDGLSS